MSTATLYLDLLDAVIFDLDGVVTDTATAHAVAWKVTFDAFLGRYGSGNDLELPNFDLHDYIRYVAGKPRFDGVRSFLASRGIELPEHSDSGDSVAALAEERTRRSTDEIDRQRVMAYVTTVAFVSDLRRRHVPTAVVSSVWHCGQPLRAVRMDHLFDVRVDGKDLDRLGLPGKPEPAPFAEAAHQLGARPTRCAVVAGSIAGVEAGHLGGFGVVVGVDRRGDLSGEMYESGANVVVSTLADVLLVRSRACHGSRT